MLIYRITEFSVPARLPDRGVVRDAGHGQIELAENADIWSGTFTFATLDHRAYSSFRRYFLNRTNVSSPLSNLIMMEP